MKTVVAIKVKIGQASDTCEVTRDKLVSLTEFDLSGENIVDVSPLAGLTGLTRLILWDNQIKDVSPYKQVGLSS